MKKDNSNPFGVPEPKKENIFTTPVPLWSLGAALITGSLLTFGITSLVNEEPTHTQAHTSDTSPAAPASPASTESNPSPAAQSNPSYPETEVQEAAAIGEATANHGVRVTVNSVEIVSELSIRKKYSAADSNDLESLTPSNEGAKFALVNATIANEGAEDLSLSCGFNYSTRLENPQGQRYKTIEDNRLIPGNPDCISSDSVAPGFSEEISYAYEVPDSYEWGYFTYSDPAVSEARDNPTRVRLDQRE